MSELIAKAKADLEKGKSRMLNTFQHVPDDKLNYSPGGAAKTPLQLVGHCGFSGMFLSEWIAGRAQPNPADHDRAGAENSVQTREAAVAVIEESVQKIQAVLDSLTEANLSEDRPAPFGGPFTVRDLMFLPALHLFSHASQIDYLQTIWGDTDWHM